MSFSSFGVCARLFCSVSTCFLVVVAEGLSFFEFDACGRENCAKAWEPHTVQDN